MVERSIYAACVACLLAVLPGTAQAQQQPQHVVFTESLHSFLNGAMYVAIAEGYLKDAGIDAEVVTSGGGSKAMAAMLSGSAQIYIGAPIELLNAVNRGVKVVAFASLVDRPTLSFVMRKDTADRLNVTRTSPLAERVASFKGLNIGIGSPRSSSDGFFSYVFGKAKYDPDRDAVRIPVGDGPSALAAFVNKKVDVIVYSSPVIELAVERGPGVELIDLSSGEIQDYVGYPYQSLVARQEWLEANPEIVTNIIRGLARAEKLLHENPDEARKVLRGVFPDLKEQLFDLSFKRNMLTYSANPTVHPDKFQTAFDEFAFVMKQPVKKSKDEVATNKYVAAALK